MLKLDIDYFQSKIVVYGRTVPKKEEKEKT
jgi:hypothetical protein